MSELNESVEVTVSALSRAALDWAVAKAEGLDVQRIFGSWCIDWFNDDDFYTTENIPKFSSDWDVTGPLIDKYAIGFWGYDADNWQAQSSPEDVVYTGIGPTHLIAACRLIVSAKFGKVVSVPKELIS